MEQIIDDIAELLKQSHGIDISDFEESFLRKSLTNRISESSCKSINEYCDQLKTNYNEASQLLDSLHVYSEFFRNPLTFAYLEQFVLPQLWSNKKKNKEAGLRIWSAACASGQEAYSLAILLDELIDSLHDKPEFHIFATDNNPDELERARKGMYDRFSLNKVTFKRMQKYFTAYDDNFEISPSVSKYVDFSYFDLLSDRRACPEPSIYGFFDLVVCSNLLFYYKPESRKAILEKIRKTMAPGAFLVTGETERDILLKHNFHEVFENSAIFKKSV